MQLRILLVTESSSAGVGRHVLDLAGGLLNDGCDVHLIYSDLRLDEAFSKRLTQLSLLSRQIVRMRRSPHLSDMHAVRAVKHYVSQHGPFDIIHGHSSKGGAIARLAGIGLPVKTVYTPNAIVSMNPEFSRPVSFLYQSIEKALGWFTDTVIATAQEELSHVLRVVHKDRTAMIPNCIDMPTFLQRSQARDELGLPQDRTIVGFVGRMSQQKNPLLLVDAFKLVQTRFPEAILAMIGDGPLLGAVRHRVSEHGLESSVHLLGKRNAPELMKAFDIFALSSRYEGMPYVLLESINAGLPVVSTKVSGADSLVLHGISGYVVDSSSPDEFAMPLCDLLTDADLRSKYSEAAKNHADEFRLTSMIEKTHFLYQRLVEPNQHTS